MSVSVRVEWVLPPASKRGLAVESGVGEWYCYCCVQDQTVRQIDQSWTSMLTQMRKDRGLYSIRFAAAVGISYFGSQESVAVSVQVFLSVVELPLHLPYPHSSHSLNRK
jgi:hypothetical protein